MIGPSYGSIRIPGDTLLASDLRRVISEAERPIGDAQGTADIRSTSTEEQALRNDFELAQGRGIRDTFPAPRDLNIELLNIERRALVFPDTTRAEVTTSNCHGDLQFDNATPAYLSGGISRGHLSGAAFTTNSPLGASVALLKDRTSYLWLKAQADGQFTYSCGPDLKTESLRSPSSRWCLGPFCRNTWANKDVLVEVVSLGSNVSVQVLAACATAPQGAISELPSTCTPTDRYHEAIWPVRGYAQATHRLVGFATSGHL